LTRDNAFLSITNITHMITKICEKCDSEMKLVPAGYSRAKNKPYPAFWSCDKRAGGCGATSRAEGGAAAVAPAGAEADRLAAIEQKLDEILLLIKTGGDQA
jgi:hypothetical protein